MPTFTHGSTAVLKIQDSGGTLRDVSNVSNTASLDVAIDTADVTAFSNTAKAYIPGLEDATFSVDGHRDATVEGYLWGIRRLVRTWEYYPEGTASGLVKYSGSAIMTTMSVSSSVDDANKQPTEFQVTGGVTRAIV